MNLKTSFTKLFLNDRAAFGFWSLVFGLMAVVVSLSMTGCKSTVPGNTGQVQSYSFPTMEAEWIRNGEPISYDNKLWYPADGVETLTDAEVFYLGEYKGVSFFVDKVDIRPYDRIYTKFGKNLFRYFIVKSINAND